MVPVDPGSRTRPVLRDHQGGPLRDAGVRVASVLGFASAAEMGAKPQADLRNAAHPQVRVADFTAMARPGQFDAGCTHAYFFLRSGAAPVWALWRQDSLLRRLASLRRQRHAFRRCRNTTDSRDRRRTNQRASAAPTEASKGRSQKAGVMSTVASKTTPAGRTAGAEPGILDAEEEMRQGDGAHTGGRQARGQRRRFPMGRGRSEVAWGTTNGRGAVSSRLCGIRCIARGGGGNRRLPGRKG